jgi:hypothetical protein
MPNVRPDSRAAWVVLPTVLIASMMLLTVIVLVVGV